MKLIAESYCSSRSTVAFGSWSKGLSGFSELIYFIVTMRQLSYRISATLEDAMNQVTSNSVHIMPYFKCTHLIMQGTAYGMIYLPSATIVSQWFAKRRATATGISACGSSIGVAVYSLFMAKLLKIYSWRGCMIIAAALSLHCFAAGCLFIPLRDYQKSHPKKNAKEKKETANSELAVDGGLLKRTDVSY